jgi:hypothetical protein
MKIFLFSAALLLSITALSQNYGIVCEVTMHESKLLESTDDATEKVPVKNEKLSFYAAEDEFTDERTLRFNDYELKVKLRTPSASKNPIIYTDVYKNGNLLVKFFGTAQGKVTQLEADGSYQDSFNYNCKCKIDQVTIKD